MFTHVVVGSNDLQKSKAFYDAVFATLGAGEGQDAGHRLFYNHGDLIFVVTTPINGEAATHANGGTIGFYAKDAEQANAWHDAGITNGGNTCEDPPGMRDFGERKLYLAYLRDPDGNKLCAMHPVS